MYCVYHEDLGYVKENGKRTDNPRESALFDNWLDAAAFAYDHFVGEGYMYEEDFSRAILRARIKICYYNIRL